MHELPSIYLTAWEPFMHIPNHMMETFWLEHERRHLETWRPGHGTQRIGSHPLECLQIGRLAGAKLDQVCSGAAPSQSPSPTREHASAVPRQWRGQAHFVGSSSKGTLTEKTPLSHACLRPSQKPKYNSELLVVQGKISQ